MILKRLAPFGLFALAACVSQTTPPPPPPTQKPPERPTPPPPPPPSNWMDAPRTPGDWSYQQDRATYGRPGGAPLFTLACERQAGRITLARAGSAPSRVGMRILTETTSRTLDATPSGANLSAALPVRDPLLDAMAFSKGRFAVETSGLPTLYLPSWSEVSRVIEDCR